MAGGDAGASMLEANPGALAVVVIFFLVFTLGFEAFLHWLKHTLVKKKKFGLLGAVTQFSNEIMLLGLAILVLNVCEDRIAAQCYKATKSPSQLGLQPWLFRVTGTDKVKGCACCLGKTKRVSECFLKYKGCPDATVMAKVCATPGFPYFKGVDHDSKVLPVVNGSYPYGNSSDTSSKDGYGSSSNSSSGGGYGGSSGSNGGGYAGSNGGYTSTGRRLAGPAAGAEGAYGAGEQCAAGTPYQVSYPQCGNRPGYVPIVSIGTLHQVHYLLFFMAVTHIVAGSVVLLISTSKLKWYARRSGGAQEDDIAAAAIKAAQADYDNRGSLGGVDSYKSFKAVTKDATAAGSDTRAQGDKNPSSSSSGGSGSSSGGAPGGPPSAFAVALNDGMAAEQQQRRQDGVVATVEPWHGRPVKMGWKDVCIETIVYVIRHLTLWHTVSRQEYCVLRGCFYYTHAHTLTKPVHGHSSHAHSHGHGHGDHGHEHGHGLDDIHHGGHKETGLLPEQIKGAYGPYLTEQVERDGADVVGLGLPMWLFLVLFVLLSGVTGWATWWFLILAGALLLFLNLILLTSLRHMTKGGRVVRQHKGWYQWIHRSNFLLGCIKLCLFFFTFVISNGIFMAVYYGTESCFFSRTGFQGATFQKIRIPWWAIMVIDIMLLLNLALFTLPVYSLTYHTLVVDKTLLQMTVKDMLYKQACDNLRASGNFTRTHGGGGSKRHGGGGGGGGAPAAGAAAAAGGEGGGGGLQRMVTSLRSTLSSPFSWTSTGGASLQTRRSGGVGGSKRWDAAVAVQSAGPVSDSKRWNRLQQEQSV